MTAARHSPCPQASQPAGSLPGTVASAPAVPPGAVMVEGALVFLACDDREVEEAARAALRDAFPQVSGGSWHITRHVTMTSCRRASAAGKGWRGGEGRSAPGSSIGRGGER